MTAVSHAESPADTYRLRLLEGLAAAISEAKTNGELPPRLDEGRFLLAISMMADGFFCRRAMDPNFDITAAADTLFSSMRQLAQTMLLPETETQS